MSYKPQHLHKLTILTFIFLISLIRSNNFNKPLPIKVKIPNISSSEQLMIDFIKNKKTVSQKEAFFKLEKYNLTIKEGEFTVDNIYLESINRRKGFEKRKMVFPGNDKSNILVNIKALIQNYFSRKLLYYPHPLIQSQILTLAKQVATIIYKIEKEYNRWSLLEQFLYVSVTTNVSLFGQKNYFEIGEYIKLISKKEAAMINYKDIITITSTFCGINDVFATPRTNDMMLINQLKLIIKTTLNNKSYPSYNPEKNYEVLDKFNYSKTGLLRMAQKIRVDPKVLLKGVFGYGDIVDNFFFPEIKEKLKPLHFEYCHFDTEKLKGITEPLACAPSGSFASTIFMWNSFLGVDTNKLLNNTVTKDDIKNNIYYDLDYVKARMAAVMAVYISVGFHSAAELIETYYSLLGVDLRTASTHKFFIPFLYADFSDLRDYNATDEIIEVLNKCSSKKEDLSDKTYTNKFNSDKILSEMKKYYQEEFKGK